MGELKSTFYRKSTGKFLKNLGLMIRFNEWTNKASLNFVATLILMLYLPHTEDVFRLFLIFGLYQCIFLSFGYMVNAYADREIDVFVGKNRGASYFSKEQILIMLTFLFLGVLGIPLYFRRVDLILLGLINIFFALFYSLEPLRFKEKGLWAIVVAGTSQRPFLFLFFALMVPTDLKLELILFWWLALLGLFHEIGHQLHDYKKDKKSGVITWVTTTEISTVKRVSALLFISFLLVTVSPVYIFPLYSGLSIPLLLLISSSRSINYFKKSFRAV